MTVLYIHGWASSGNSHTGQYLAQHFDCLRPDLPVHDFVRCCTQVEALLSEQDLSDLVLLGSSTGAIYAEHFANRYGLPVILVNPVIEPPLTLGRHVGQMHRNFHSGAPFMFTRDLMDAFPAQVAQSSLHPRLLLLGDLDEVIDAGRTARFFEGMAEIHRFADQSHQFRGWDSALPIVREWLAKMSASG